MNEYLQKFLRSLADYEVGFGDAEHISPQSRSRDGDTPLHIAAIQGDVRAIALLLDAGADIGAAGETGYTPLHYAVSQQRADAVRLLLERGADTSLHSEIGETPLELAEHFHHHEIQKLLRHHAAYR